MPIGDLKLSALIQRSQWDTSPVPDRVQKCQGAGVDGKVGSKSWDELTIAEALALTGKLPKENKWRDPLMTPFDYERARQNRERQYVTHPSTTEETDESRDRRRAERRTERPVRVAHPKQTPVWDPVSMKMTYR